MDFKEGCGRSGRERKKLQKIILYGFFPKCFARRTKYYYLCVIFLPFLTRNQKRRQRKKNNFVVDKSVLRIEKKSNLRERRNNFLVLMENTFHPLFEFQSKNGNSKRANFLYFYSGMGFSVVWTQKLWVCEGGVCKRYGMGGIVFKQKI